jgi:hypothetical protein
MIKPTFFIDRSPIGLRQIGKVGIEALVFVCAAEIVDLLHVEARKG